MLDNLFCKNLKLHLFRNVRNLSEIKCFNICMNTKNMIKDDVRIWKYLD